MHRRLLLLPLVICATIAAGRDRFEAGPSAAQTAEGSKSYDQILDLYVRDGFVYYRALKSERSRLDAYLASLASTPVDSLSNDQQMALWINAYNALVLRTVVDHYPIARRTTEYPQHSIRQIPGAFERIQHHVAGRHLTLDQIEQTVLPAFHDPRVYLALGRGAVGGGRLRSEVYTGDRLQAQLKEVAAECVSRPQCIQIDRDANRIGVSSIFSWREKDFVAAYAESAPGIFASRSPVERAVLALVGPGLLTTEREFVSKNEFQMTFLPFDWTLNDLTGRGGR